MKHSHEIAFAFPRGSIQEVFIEGVYQYAQEHEKNWSYIIAPEWNAVSITQLTDWPGDGVIAALNTPQEAKCAARFHLPVVNISSALEISPVPRTMVDNHAIGVLAAEHLMDRGFREFGYYGLADIEYSKERLRGFEGTLADSQCSVSTLLVPSTFRMKGKEWLKQQQELIDWLEALPVPFALFAVSDARARQAIYACEELGMRVPEQVAVLGVDDQQIICEHSQPTISSIARNNIREGYQAAMVLDRLMRKKEVESKDFLVRPVGVVTRESTTVFAIGEQRLRKALLYFQENIEEPITVAEICSHVDVSRRWLEYAFRSLLGESPFNYIRRQRLKHARRLLREEADTRIDIIARRAGYASANQLAKAFRQEFGESPSDFRRSIRT